MSLSQSIRSPTATTSAPNATICRSWPAPPCRTPSPVATDRVADGRPAARSAGLGPLRGGRCGHCGRRQGHPVEQGPSGAEPRRRYRHRDLRARRPDGRQRRHPAAPGRHAVSLQQRRKRSRPLCPDSPGRAFIGRIRRPPVQPFGRSARQGAPGGRRRNGPV